MLFFPPCDVNRKEVFYVNMASFGAPAKHGKSLNNREIKNQPHKNETDGSIANASASNLLLQCFAISQTDSVPESLYPNPVFVRRNLFCMGSAPELIAEYKITFQLAECYFTL